MQDDMKSSAFFPEVYPEQQNRTLCETELRLLPEQTMLW